jgi:hypothetical protein
MNSLSEGFARASKSADDIEQDVTTDAADLVIGTLVRELRLTNPNDCRWQADITSAFGPRNP